MLYVKNLRVIYILAIFNMAVRLYIPLYVLLRMVLSELKCVGNSTKLTTECVKLSVSVGF